MSGYDKAASSLAGIQFFRGADGKNKAVVVGSGNAALIRIRGGKALNLLKEQVSEAGDATNALNGSGRPTQAGLGPTGDRVKEWAMKMDQIFVTDALPGDRYILASNGLTGSGKDKNNRIDTTTIGNGYSSQQNHVHFRTPEEAAENLATLPEKIQKRGRYQYEGKVPANGKAADPEFEAAIDDLTVGVIDLLGPEQANQSEHPEHRGKAKSRLIKAVGALAAGSAALIAARAGAHELHLDREASAAYYAFLGATAVLGVAPFAVHSVLVRNEHKRHRGGVG